jgi:hypothetical protein
MLADQAAVDQSREVGKDVASVGIPAKVGIPATVVILATVVTDELGRLQGEAALEDA